MLELSSHQFPVTFPVEWKFPCAEQAEQQAAFADL